MQDANQVDNESVAEKPKQAFPKLFQLYLWVVSGLGILIFAVGLLQIFQYDALHIYFLLVLLAVLGQFASSSVEGITFEISSAVGLAIVPIYGPLGGSTAMAFSYIIQFAYNAYAKPKGWKGAWSPLLFNMGLSTVSMLLGGLIWHFLAGSLPNTLLAVIFTWVVAAVVQDQVNLWMLLLIIHLQSGAPMRGLWEEHRWAVPINVLVLTAGGGVLSGAVQQFNLQGIIIFFLPVVLSAYAFRLYINQTQSYLEKLEDMVAERTKELEEANNQLSDLHKEKNAFLAVLAHDMRTPLTSIKGFATLLRDMPGLPAEQRQMMLDTIIRSEESLLDIVNNIVDLEKIQSGGEMDLLLEPIDLRVVVAGCVDSVRSLALDKEIELSFELGDDKVMVFVDHMKIQRVVTNLLSNGVKYTPQEGTVTAVVYTADNEAIIDVVDTGYGIPEEDLPHIFERFRRVDKHKGKAVGTGLGLAISKMLVEGHEGTITVESAEGEGSTFRVRLPLWAETETETEMEMEMETAS